MPVWSTPLLFAPMQGVGAPTLRERLSELGAPGLFCAPFIRITAQPPPISWLRQQLRRTGNLPISVQLMGNHAEHLARAASILAEAGADVVDLNLGCPARNAVRKGAGAALLDQVSDIARIVESMRRACPTCLSVKMRASESADAVLAVAKAIETAGADFLVVHPRTRQQGYGGVADWSVIRRIKAHLRIPVVGNGDVWYAADAVRLQQRSGADAVMIGRPALRNPFIFRQIQEICNHQRPFVPTGVDVLEHLRWLARRFESELAHTRRGPAGAVKEHLGYLLRAVAEPWRSKIQQRALSAKSLGEVFEAIRPLGDLDCLDLAADGPLGLETVPNDPVESTPAKGLADSASVNMFQGRNE